MEDQCQHLTELQRNKLPELLKKSEELSNGTLVTRKTEPLDFKLKLKWKADMFETISSTKGAQRKI